MLPNIVIHCKLQVSSGCCYSLTLELYFFAILSYALRYSSEGGLLDVLPTMDPLACLDDLAMQQPGLRPSAYEEQHLVMTDDVRQNLTLLAPWLMNKEPFLLVRNARVHC